MSDRSDPLDYTRSRAAAEAKPLFAATATSITNLYKMVGASYNEGSADAVDRVRCFAVTHAQTQLPAAGAASPAVFSGVQSPAATRSPPALPVPAQVFPPIASAPAFGRPATGLVVPLDALLEFLDGMRPTDASRKHATADVPHTFGRKRSHSPPRVVSMASVSPPPAGLPAPVPFDPTAYFPPPRVTRVERPGATGSVSSGLTLHGLSFAPFQQ